MLDRIKRILKSTRQTRDRYLSGLRPEDREMIARIRLKGST